MPRQNLIDILKSAQKPDILTGEALKFRRHINHGTDVLLRILEQAVSLSPFVPEA